MTTANRCDRLVADSEVNVTCHCAACALRRCGLSYATWHTTGCCCWWWGCGHMQHPQQPRQKVHKALLVICTNGVKSQITWRDRETEDGYKNGRCLGAHSYSYSYSYSLTGCMSSELRFLFFNSFLVIDSPKWSVLTKELLNLQSEKQNNTWSVRQSLIKCRR